MPFEKIPKSLSPAAMAELDAEIARRQVDDAYYLQDKVDATAFGQKCRYEWEQANRVDRAEHVATEVLEVVLTPGAGALAAWKTEGGFPIGAIVNGVVGGGAKAVSIWGPENRALRAAARAGKVLLHSQISITTHNLIRGGS